MTRTPGKAAAGKRVKSLRVRGKKAGGVKGGALRKTIMLPAPTVDLAPVGGGPKPK
jgi:hypothetical protein